MSASRYDDGTYVVDRDSVVWVIIRDGGMRRGLTTKEPTRRRSSGSRRTVARS